MLQFDRWNFFEFLFPIYDPDPEDGAAADDFDEDDFDDPKLPVLPDVEALEVSLEVLEVFLLLLVFAADPAARAAAGA